MRNKIFPLIIISLLFMVDSTHAIGRGPGARAAAMGGAYSALANGIEAYCWNPAGIVTSKIFSSMIGAGGNSTLSTQQATDLISQLKTSQGRSKYLEDNIFKEIKIFGEGDVPLGVSMGNFGIATWGYAYAAANKRAIDYQFMLYGGYTLEYGLIYGDSLGLLSPLLKNLYWGASLRGFNGEARTIYYSILNWAQLPDGTLVNYGLDASDAFSNGLGGDIGLKYEGENYAIALAGKELAASYDQKSNYNYRQVDYNTGTLGKIIGTYETTSKVTMDPRWLLGFAYYYEPLGTLASLDIETYKTTAVSFSDADFGKTVQVIDYHVGLEKKIIDWLALRTGLSAENYSKLAEVWFTYGLGINFSGWHLDLAAGNATSGKSQLFVQTLFAF